MMADGRLLRRHPPGVEGLRDARVNGGAHESRQPRQRVVLQSVRGFRAGK
jgi:hypothetical protein